MLFRPSGILVEPVNLTGMRHLSCQAVHEKGMQVGLHGGGKLKRAEPVKQQFNKLCQFSQNQAVSVCKPGILYAHDQTSAVFPARTEVIQLIIPVIIKIKYPSGCLQVPHMRIGNDIIDRIQVDLAVIFKKGKG